MNQAENARRSVGGWRIAIVEDHLLQRKRTEELIESQPAFSVVYSAENLPSLVQWLSTCGPNLMPQLVILDLVVERQPDADPAMVQRLVDAGVHVLVLSAMTSPPLVREMLRVGIAGVVGKRDSEEDIIAAVWSVLGRRTWMTQELAAVIAGDQNRPRLSEQEERALVFYASGLTLAGVADALGVKRDTAKTYLDRVRAKYTAAGRPARSKVDLSRIAVADGYLDLDTTVDDPPV